MSAAAHAPDEIFEGLKVVVVEDDILLQFYAEDILKEVGCAVVGRAQTLPDAFETIEAVDHDAVILDLQLKYDQAHAIATLSAARGTAVVLATCTSRHELPIDLTNFAIAQKPYTSATLLSALRSALEKTTFPSRMASLGA